MKARERLRNWLSRSTNLVEASVLLFLPAVIFTVVELSQRSTLGFLVFPPIASASYSLFFDPEGIYSTPKKLVGGMTLGAFLGVLSFHLGGFTGLAAASAVFSTSLASWLLDIDHPSGLSASLLGVLLRPESFIYPLAVFGVTASISGLFLAWRSRIYEERANYLYKALRDEAKVLAVIREEDRVSTLASRMALKNVPGKLVLVSLGSHSESEMQYKTGLLEHEELETDYEIIEEGTISRIEDCFREHDCSIMVFRDTNHGEELDEISQELLDLGKDSLIFRLDSHRESFRDAFVPVKKSSKLSRLMVESASRLVEEGKVSATNYIDSERYRRKAEKELFSLVSSFETAAKARSDILETRIVDNQDKAEEMITKSSEKFDLTVTGTRGQTGFRKEKSKYHKIISAAQRPVLIVHKKPYTRIYNTLKTSLASITRRDHAGAGI